MSHSYRKSRRVRRPVNLVFVYIYLAVGTAAAGLGLTFLMLFVAHHFEINIGEHLWMVAIPPVTSVILNVLLVEWYKSRRKK